MTRQPQPEASPHRFEHEAMATVFSLKLVHPDAHYARQAAAEAFRECDRLEGELSRYTESSSLTRINRSAPGAVVPVNADTYLCLKQALHLADCTGGAFDPAFRSRPAGALPQPAIELCADRVAVRLLRPDPDLDLGGIGKGYALDQMARLLKEWSIPSALLSGGWSSTLALGSPPDGPGWEIGLLEGSPTRSLPAGWALSASGYAVQGAHVRDPASGEPVTHHVRAWALAPSAVVSDALSTAFLVLSADEVAAFTRQFPDCGAVLQQPDGTLQECGHPLPVSASWN